MHHGIECRPRARKRKAEEIQRASPGRSTSLNIELDFRQTRSDGTRRGRRTAKRAPQVVDAHTTPASTAVTTAFENGGDIDLAAPLLFVSYQDFLVNSPSTNVDTAEAPVDRFHNSSYLSRSAILGNDFPDIDHSHVDKNIKQHRLSLTEMQVLELYGAFDLPDMPLRQSLFEAFQEKCWTWMPVVDILSHTQAGLSTKTSLLPLQAIMLVGALMRPDVCDKATCDTYYYRVKSLIHSGYERNPMNLLAAMCLVQYYTPTAPKDVSVDTPRFWWSSALGIAQQIGLHRQPTRRGHDYGLRRRVWWTMYVRDSIMSSCHGRPRLLRLADSTMDPPSIHDFPDPNSTRARIFVSYVGITEIMCDLCELLVNSNPLTAEARHGVEQRLLNYVREFPEELKLCTNAGLQHPYDFELVQLHIPLLTTMIILHRPQSVFSLKPSNAAGVTAAYLSFRIFQAIALREQTRFLGSAFSWYLLVAAIPHLSSLRIPALRNEANKALDTIESVLATLGTVRPSAATNLRNVKAIREALNGPETVPSRNLHPTDIATSATHEPSQSQLTYEALGIYGSQALQNFDAISNAIRHARDTTDEGIAADVTADLDGMTNVHTPCRQHDVHCQRDVTSFDEVFDVQGTFDSRFGSHFQESIWMRDWIDELQHFPA